MNKANVSFGKNEYFRISSFCAGGECIAVRMSTDEVVVKGTRHQVGTEVRFSIEEWSAFVKGVKNGEFDIARARC